MKNIPTGVWVHYKDHNREYRIVCVATSQYKQAELDHQPIVIYEALYEVTDTTHKFWARPLADFLEYCILPNGETTTRFIKVRE
ncbi:MAG: hypothetical protein RI996_227 [Candidatus Parcubacteria bacterium]|jgi:hypothetical protein